MSEQDEREALANLIPLGFTERDPYRDAYEAADAILAWVAERGYRKQPEPEWEYGVRWVLTPGHPVTDLGADRAEVLGLAEYQEKYAEAVRREVGPWVPVEEERG